MQERARDVCDRTFRFAVAIVRFCRQLDERPGVSRTLSKQLLRSGTSIGANVEEAQAGQSRNDFISKYSIALKEARETSYWLRLLIASEVNVTSSAVELQKEVMELARILGAIIVATKRSN